ncbi:PPC domain-containing DNA-binding protein [Chlamydiota bacterium]
MQYSEGTIGRIFVLRLEHDESLPNAIETFALEKDIKSGMCILIGGVNDGSKIVVGPRDGEQLPPIPMNYILNGVHEVLGVGTLFQDEEGIPKLHMHASLGREGKTSSGCIRPGISIWHVGEVIIFEMITQHILRKNDEKTGFSLLEIVKKEIKSVKKK